MNYLLFVYYDDTVENSEEKTNEIGGSIAADICGMYEFENAWVMQLIYNHIEQ